VLKTHLDRQTDGLGDSYITQKKNLFAEGYSEIFKIITISCLYTHLFNLTPS